MTTFFGLSPILTADDDRAFIQCYPALVGFFDRNERFSADDFVCAAHMVYAWMPRILRLHRYERQDFERGADIVQRARTDGAIDDEDLVWLIGTVDNSLVAVSKLLHFARPDRFAIWDSRVQRFLLRNSGAMLAGYAPETWRDARDPGTYRAYLELLTKLVAADEFALLHQRVAQAIGQEGQCPQPVTPFRAAEFVMYSNGAEVMKTQEAG